MEIIPAIDIKGGKCVRLYQGDYNQETVFSEDPTAVAQQWKGQGAKKLHLVDLDGAAAGKPLNLEVIEAIVEATGLPVQFGGGVRTEDTVIKLLSLGVQRVILGTIAIEQPELVKMLCLQFRQSIMISIDARNGLVATRGWKHSTNVTAVDLAQQLAKIGVARIQYTDINRDGTLTEPDFNATRELINSVKIPVLAAGGIASLEHLQKLKQIGVEGVIIGKALYTGNIDLKEALKLEDT